MGVSNFTGPRESKLTIPRARKMAKHSKIPRIVNEIPGNLRANSQEKAVKLERKALQSCLQQLLTIFFINLQTFRSQSFKRLICFILAMY